MITLSQQYWDTSKALKYANYLYTHGKDDAQIKPEVKQQLFANMTGKLISQRDCEKQYKEFIEKANSDQKSILDSIKQSVDELKERE